jgi:hypothetical protein
MSGSPVLPVAVVPVPLEAVRVALSSDPEADGAFADGITWVARGCDQPGDTACRFLSPGLLGGLLDEVELKPASQLAESGGVRSKAWKRVPAGRPERS